MADDKNSLLSLFSNEEHDHLSTDSGLSPQARPLSGEPLSVYSEGGYVTEPAGALYCKHSSASLITNEFF